MIYFNNGSRSVFRLIEQALAVGFADPADYRKIWLAYVDFLRRRMADKDDDKSKFEKGQLYISCCVIFQPIISLTDPKNISI